MLFGKKKKAADYIVDVHCHILPGIDDGSRDMSETLKMLEIAHDEGITHMIATPHFKGGHHNASPEKVSALINEVQEAADGCKLGIKLYQGNEILYHDELCEGVDNGRISRMNDTDYVLVEFMPSDPYQYIRNSLDEIAHVERYGCMLDDVENVREIKNMGVEIQVNASSILGDIGRDVKKFLHKLLSEQIIDYVGTDAHRCEGSRTPKIRECAGMLYKKYEEQYVDDILYGNAMDRLL